MSEIYRLVNHGYPWKTIVKGRVSVGRVAKAGDKWYGTIGKDTVTADTEIAAFRRVAARAMGFATPEALQAQNARIRARNRAVKEHGRHVANEMLRGNFEPFFDMLGPGPLKKKDETRE